MAHSLYEALLGLNRLPMHMPGHKRNALLAPYLQGLGAAMDITEIQGFDNLRAPEGILQAGMALAARLYSAAASFYLVGGTTAGILAGVRALTSPGDKVLLQRSSHLSVYNALAMNSLQPVYLHSPLLPGWGVEAPLSLDLLQQALAQHPNARLLVLTSPSYEGVLEDLPSLIAAAKQAGLWVLVDAAHGAHLGLHPGFPAGATQAGADIVVHSLHKTLPALTQTGLAHAATADIAQRLAEQLNLFQTSSPSYLLMASIDGCLRLLDQQGDKLFAAWQAGLSGFRQAVQGLSHLRLLAPGPGLPGLDPSKLFVSTGGTNITGYTLIQRLREEQGIELEMAAPQGAMALSGMGDEAADLLRLADALLAIDQGLQPAPMPAIAPLPEVQAAWLPHEALTLPYQLCPMEQAVGRIAAEYLMMYPPGAPLLVPGERVSAQLLPLLQSAQSLLKTRSSGQPNMLALLS